MKRIVAIAAAALLAGASLALAQDQSDTVLPKAGTTPTEALPAAPETQVDTPTFVKAAPSANAFEIESSKLAQDKASADDVKTFAALMIKDHTKAGEGFSAALDRSQTTGSVTPAAPAMLPEDQAMLDELKGLSGDEFQARYIEMQTQAHKKAVALFSAYANSGDDPALKEFAKATLPVLKMHEKHVKELAAAHI